mmetsp:Transcript_18461/g.46435  ORF Transcript_18461/g.46435 Transcript_18461/m.46435 type:complete len:233 (-) Transcript_18461:1631-2329(-)
MEEINVLQDRSVLEMSNYKERAEAPKRDFSSVCRWERQLRRNVDMLHEEASLLRLRGNGFSANRMGRKLNNWNVPSDSFSPFADGESERPASVNIETKQRRGVLVRRVPFLQRVASVQRSIVTDGQNDDVRASTPLSAPIRSLACSIRQVFNEFKAIVDVESYMVATDLKGRVAQRDALSRIEADGGDFSIQTVTPREVCKERISREWNSWKLNLAEYMASGDIFAIPDCPN